MFSRAEILTGEEKLMRGSGERERKDSQWLWEVGGHGCPWSGCSVEGRPLCQ